jgi:AraC family transcriptional regulator, transcriptional activator of the genes for pyochelin and ferripyochelin receptors
MPSKHSVIVSPEMTSFVGPGTCDRLLLPPDALLIGFGEIGEPVVSTLALRELESEEHLLVFAVSRGACRRLFGELPDPGGRWYLPSDLRALGQSIVAPECDAAAADTLRLARSIEMLCQLFAALRAGNLVAVDGQPGLTESDIARIAINRDKLTRGFRELYHCSVGEALSERRLRQARTLLAASDLPVASIGYRCGYLNNASFTRAFSRRFGMAPTAMRRLGVAA